ncbi:MAG: SAM-dependent methyltransferase [Pseudomonadota bacterium]
MNLKDVILRRIRAQGPLTISEYMETCLLHPEHGYYTTRDPLGRSGDFVTAPEISQMFGELIGLCLAQSWLDQKCPAPFTLAELGPGHGTLMADILRATAQVPGFVESAEIHLVEASERMREQQRDNLQDYAFDFANDVESLPNQPLIFVANEFFDALPIRQFQRTALGWREKQVGLTGDNLIVGLGPEADLDSLSNRKIDTRTGDIVEVATRSGHIVQKLGACIAQHGGAGLIIDYGDWRSLGDTLQAVQNHATTDLLDAPGAADLTAHVDFEMLALASGCAYSRLTPQGVFLERLGITMRAKALAARLEGLALDQHIVAHRRLTHPEEMGNLFKVLGLFPRGAQPPAGLET